MGLSHGHTPSKQRPVETRCSRRARLARRPQQNTDVVTGFHDTIEKGSYESICGGTTSGVMGVLIKKRSCVGVKYHGDGGVQETQIAFQRLQRVS